MRITKFLSILLLTLIVAINVSGQIREVKNANTSTPQYTQEVKSSATFAEIIFRQAELQSDLGELLVAYTDEYPKVRQTKYELEILNNDLNNISKLKGVEANILTQALGKLLVRRAEISTDFWVNKEQYDETHPNFKKAKRKLDIYNEAIKKILD